ncbi:MAG: heme o synthase [Pseudomonadota bacterium]
MSDTAVVSGAPTRVDGFVSRPGTAGGAARPGDYVALLKPRVMSLVIFTALVGIVAAPGVPDVALGLIALFAIAVGAGASGALNMWWDADIDAVMARTAGRPIPRGAVPAAEAFGFGTFLSILAVILLALASNYFAAGLLAFTIFFYVVVYSMWLKRSTPQNIVIGGAAGAFPPVVGWAAAGGGAPLEAWTLFALIFLWTPPHFWALALCRENDYARAGVPMMPNVRGADETKRQIVIYSVLVAIAGVAPAMVGLAGVTYGALAGVAGLVFVQRAFAVYKAPPADKKPAKALFAFSILYLFGLFALLLLDVAAGDLRAVMGGVAA